MAYKKSGLNKSKELDLSLSEVFDPDVMPMETLVYNRALMAQHYRIERSSSQTLIGNPNENRRRLNGLWGAMYTMIMNLYDHGKPEYKKAADNFIKLDATDYGDDSLNDFFKEIMKMHKYNISEYRNMGLLPARGVAMFAGPTSEQMDESSKKAEEV